MSLLQYMHAHTVHCFLSQLPRSGNFGKPWLLLTFVLYNCVCFFQLKKPKKNKICNAKLQETGMYEKYTIYDENYPSSAQLLIFCNAHLNSKTFTKKKQKKI